MSRRPIVTHSFCFNPKDNSGESLTVLTQFIPNGDPGGFFTNQQITLQSYYNSASIDLSGIAITPALLRKLANELDLATAETKDKLAATEQIKET